MDEATAAAARAASKPDEHFNIVIVGHVDHGKSTLVGRLYADTGSLPEGKLEKVQAICRQQGKEFEYAFLFDAFLEEQEQGITIDTARTFFIWKGRQYIIIDAPGHKEFLKNMISGAARAEAALLVIDALEGVKEQSKKHGYLLSLLGVRQFAVVVNKMDLVGYRQDVFDGIEKEYREFLGQFGAIPERIIPVSAKLGDNIADRSRAMPWYGGPTVLDTLSLFKKETASADQPLRFPVQDVYKFDARRIIAGRITAGRLKVGDQLIFSPSNKRANVKSIEAFNVEPLPMSAEAGQSIGVTLDEQIFVERGEIAAHPSGLPHVSTSFKANLFWLGKRPLERGRKYVLRVATKEVECEVAALHRIIDTTDLNQQQDAAVVSRNQVAELTLRTKTPIAFDVSSSFEATGRFVLVDEYDIAGGGIVTEMVPDDQESLREEARRRDFAWVKGEVGVEDRAKHYGHRSAVVLFTGGRHAGKSLLARKLEGRLIADGRHAYLLDGENLRRGLDADLSEEEKSQTAEMARRYGEVARLLIDTGLIVVSTTNPFGLAYREASQAIRTLVHPAPVIAVHVSKTAEEPPPNTDVILNGPVDLDVAIKQVMDALKQRGVLDETLGAKPTFQYSI
ncbi:GTP-binding protein [Candidatus Nitrospira inopinata]|jgi:bifunctional enzyme CysN/CysC|uniref:sulfate adenylyltransferase n=1 Tax=Candidatus Nitrospira inopinata TaxID=1715989 RepID=A0A0S4KP79_9BACT|nr:GTP-binding protein [Candidatus Nitrospira inopinata]CUQ66252.1 Sulfate adenylyltransferase, subunit 1, and adenylylsulfate kinase (bifunctional enzyme) [Candidatus Nitrospira inopinata]